MGPGVRVETFDRMTLRGRRYWFRGVDAGNNEPLYPSQTYKDRQARDETAWRLARAFGTAPVPSKR